MKIRDLEVINVSVNPMIQYGNKPSLYIQLDGKLPSNEDLFYTKSGPFYYTQQSCGYTHFLYCNSPLVHIGKKNGYSHYETSLKDSGFGGHRFTLKVGIPGSLQYVDLCGPWSSGCYGANTVLPKHSIEVGYYNYGSTCGIGANITIEKANELLMLYNPNWDCVIHDSLSSKVAPELRYKGKFKSELNVSCLVDEQEKHNTFVKSLRK